MVCMAPIGHRLHLAGTRLWGSSIPMGAVIGATTIGAGSVDAGTWVAVRQQSTAAGNDAAATRKTSLEVTE